MPETKNIEHIHLVLLFLGVLLLSLILFVEGKSFSVKDLSKHDTSVSKLWPKNHLSSNSITWPKDHSTNTSKAWPANYKYSAKKK